MLRLGAAPQSMACFQDSELLRLNIHLLILTMRARLNWESLGRRRLKIMRRLAQAVAFAFRRWETSVPLLLTNRQGHPGLFEHILFQRIRLLSMMALSISQSPFVGARRLAALANNLDYLFDALDIAIPQAFNRLSPSN